MQVWVGYALAVMLVPLAFWSGSYWGMTRALVKATPRQLRIIWFRDQLRMAKSWWSYDGFVGRTELQKALKDFEYEKEDHLSAMLDAERV